MNPEERRLKKKVNKAVIIIVVLLLSMCFVAIKCDAQCVGESYFTGYDTETTFDVKHQKNLVGVRKFIDAHSIVEINFEMLLLKSNYFDVKTEDFYLYVERKAVYRKKNGKLKYKKMNKKRHKEVQSYIRKNKPNKSI